MSESMPESEFEFGECKEFIKILLQDGYATSHDFFPDCPEGYKGRYVAVVMTLESYMAKLITLNVAARTWWHDEQDSGRDMGAGFTAITVLPWELLERESSFCRGDAAWSTLYRSAEIAADRADGLLIKLQNTPVRFLSLS
jgi:hypothetical protein